MNDLPGDHPKPKAGTLEVLARWFRQLRSGLLIGALLVAFLSVVFLLTLQEPGGPAPSGKPDRVGDKGASGPPVYDDDAFVYSFFELPDTWEEKLYYQIRKDIRSGLTPREPDKSQMVLIPAGEAVVGANPKDRINGQCLPPQKRWVDSFYLDRFETTNAQYNRCVDEKQCMPVVALPHMGDYFEPDHPALLTVKQAERYCLWAGKRLPTEWEWEKAARGADGRTYPWGNQPPDFSRANICGKECPSTTSEPDWNDPFPHTAPVGSFPAGAAPSGLMDMSGNVKEWVDSELADPGRNAYVARGSSWYSGKAELVSYYRQQWIPGVRVDDKGVRCAADGNER